MLKLNRLCLLALLATFTNCDIHKEYDTTEVSGTVTDIETHAPIADVKLDLTVASSIDNTRRLQEPIYYSCTSDAQGNYSFIFHDDEDHQLYILAPEKAGYVEVKQADQVTATLNHGDRNTNEVKMARASYLALSVSQVPVPGVTKEIKLWVNYTTSTPENSQSAWVSQFVNPTEPLPDTLLMQGFYYKQSPKVQLKWEVTLSHSTDMTTQTHEAIVDLTEYQTTPYKISY